MRMVGEQPVLWRPNPGPQSKFCASTTRELLYGGAAGGGKSSAIVATSLKWVHNPNFRALILRRETKQLFKLLDEAQNLYPKAFPGAKYNGTDKIWHFPSGAKVRFNHCEHEGDALIYDGDEFHYIAFDELTHFTRAQYRAICSRLRGPDPTLPRYVRASTNPGGPGHVWVFDRWAPWLNPMFESPNLPKRFDTDGKRLPPAAPGQRLWVVQGDKVEHFFPHEVPDALSRTFIPAKLSDNPKLLENDPTYRLQLKDNDPLRRKQLEDGDWLAKPVAGAYFKRQMFEIVDAAPTKARRIRYWDRAATEPSESNPDPDWTRGVKLARAPDGLWYIEDIVPTRSGPKGVEDLVKQTAQLDGKGVEVGIEQDPGQAGKVEAAMYIKLLAGWTVRAYPVSGKGDKEHRAKPVSAQAAAGNIKLVRGPWIEAFLAEVEDFPEGGHDDQVDGLSGAFGALLMEPDHSHLWSK